MTARELYEKYKNVFILAIETAGESTNNEVYKKAESIINSEEFTELINGFIDSGARFDLLIVQMVCALVLKIHGFEKLKESNLMEYGEPIFELYLKKPTRIFCQQNGVPVIKQLAWAAILHKVTDDE